ncbi:MAG: hypothetical protein QOC95_2306, partial [Thermoleophilaceae bacterium]|nr:hypothetical protein [Thermoleophilaceae bacterium]
GEVNVTFTLTSPGCPIGPQVSDQMKEFVGELDGVEAVHPHMTFDPAWTPDLMSEDAKFALGYKPTPTGSEPTAEGAAPFAASSSSRSDSAIASAT